MIPHGGKSCQVFPSENIGGKRQTTVSFFPGKNPVHPDDLRPVQTRRFTPSVKQESEKRKILTFDWLLKFFNLRKTLV